MEGGQARGRYPRPGHAAEDQAEDQPEDQLVAQADVAALSIAVLPFPDLSAEQDQAYFCDGLTDELIGRLARVPSLRVASRSSSFAFKGQNADLRSAADKLKVAHILEGGVRKDGNRVRISAQLTEVASDTILWAETYDRELCDILAIQQDLAGCILDALKLQLGTVDLSHPNTTNRVAEFEWIVIYERDGQATDHAEVVGHLAHSQGTRSTRAHEHRSARRSRRNLEPSLVQGPP